MGKLALFHVVVGSVIETNWRLVLHYLLTVRIQPMFDLEISLSGIGSPVTLVYMCKVIDPGMLSVVLFVIAEVLGQLDGFMWVIVWRTEDCPPPAPH